MANTAAREALRGEEGRILDIVSEAFSTEEWGGLLKCALKGAAAVGDRSLAHKLLVGAGAQVGTSLHLAIQGGHRELVNDLLESGVEVDVQGLHGNFPIHVAAKVGDEQITRSLLLKGATWAVTNYKRRSPLYVAARNGRLAVLQALLAAEGDVADQRREHRLAAIRAAAGEGHVDILREMIQQGEHVNADDSLDHVDYCFRSEGTALYAACFARDESKVATIINMLVEAGANVEAQERDGSRPLHAAARVVRLDGVLALLKHGADVNAKDNEGRTPLFWAAHMAGRRSAPVVNMLLRSGADETIVDQYGRDAAEMIQSRIRAKKGREDVELVRTLLKNAPVDKAWRRRGYLALCRSFPDRMRPGQHNHQTQGGTTHGIPGRAKVLRSCHKGAAGAASTKDEMRGCDSIDVALRLVGLEDEGLFRMIVSYV